MESNTFKILLIFVLFQKSGAFIRLEKSVCTTLDANFSRFDLCEIKPNKQNIAGFSMILRLFQVPITNCLVNAEVHYLTQKVLFLNTSWDACKFMKSSRKPSSILFFYNLISQHSNINHSCPYSHDIYLYDVAVGDNKLPVPIPNGNYLFRTHYMVDKMRRLMVDIHVKVG